MANSAPQRSTKGAANPQKVQAVNCHSRIRRDECPWPSIDRYVWADTDRARIAATPIPIAITEGTGIASWDRRSGAESTGVSESVMTGVLAFTLQASRVSDNRVAASGLLVAGNSRGLQPTAKFIPRRAPFAARC